MLMTTKRACGGLPTCGDDTPPAALQFMMGIEGVGSEKFPICIHSAAVYSGTAVHCLKYVTT
jgi:hypothetical protein